MRLGTILGPLPLVFGCLFASSASANQVPMPTFPNWDILQQPGMANGSFFDETWLVPKTETVYVTDLYTVGDSFGVYFNNKFQFDTPTVPDWTNYCCGPFGPPWTANPVVAYYSGDFSAMSFTVPGGTILSLTDVTLPTDFSDGTVAVTSNIPEPASLLLVLSMVGALALVRSRSQARTRTPSASAMTFAAVLLGWSAIIAQPARAQTFVANIPDFFQHQKWGLPTDTFTDPNWENGTTKEWRGGGWCFYTSTVNQFFFFKKKGFNTLPNAVTAAPPNWLPAVNDAITTFVDEGFAPNANGGKCNPPPADPVLQDATNCVLDSRMVGPKQGVNGGLIHVELLQNGVDVTYQSADGTPKVFQAGTTLFNIIPNFLKAGDAVNLFLSHAETPALWWSGPEPFKGNFHSVTVAGIDTTAGSEAVWFADPDSNPDHNQLQQELDDGNENTNGGWEFTVPPKEDAIVEGIQVRRFVTTDPLPVPANMPPNAKDISQRYFMAPMAADLMTFDVMDPDFDRYDGTTILGLNIIQTVKAAVKPAPKAPVPAGFSIFEVSPNGGTAVDEFWIFPSSSGSEFTSLSTPSGWSYQLLPPHSADPWGNIRPFGGVRVSTAGSPLTGDEILDIGYETVNGAPLSAWDAVLSLGGDPGNLRLQVFGGAIPQVSAQVPAAK